MALTVREWFRLWRAADPVHTMDMVKAVDHLERGDVIRYIDLNLPHAWPVFALPYHLRDGRLIYFELTR